MKRKDAMDLMPGDIIKVKNRRGSNLATITKTRIVAHVKTFAYYKYIGSPDKGYMDMESKRISIVKRRRR